ncbi:MAG: DNA primase [Clostridia bacterium]|nr:DNA primase [Clostridia bacterium]
MGSLFKQVKFQITTRQAAEQYGVPFSHNGMACCIFHDDRHPSMKVDERFYCFSCHATGDVIDFTAKLFGLTLWEAAKKLANDFGIQPLTPGQSMPITEAPTACSERKEEQRFLGLLVDYEQLLKEWRRKWDSASPAVEIWDERFVQAVKQLGPVDYAIDCLFSADSDERKGMVDSIKRTGIATEIEAILNGTISDISNISYELLMSV